MKKINLKSKKLIAGCLFLVVIFIGCCLGIALLGLHSYKKSESKKDYQSDVKALADKKAEVQKLSTIIDSNQKDNFPALEQQIAEYNKNTKDCSILAQKILNNDDYENYGFTENSKKSLEAIAAYNDEVNRQLDEYMAVAEYFNDLATAFEPLSRDISATVPTTSKEMKASAQPYRNLVTKLKAITPPESLKAYHASVIKDFEDLIIYLDQTVVLLEKVEKIAANPSGYSMRDLDAIEKQLNSLKMPPAPTMDSAYAEFEKNGIFSSANQQKLDQLEAEFFASLEDIE